MNPRHSRSISLLQSCSRAASVIVVLVGGFVLVGWTFDLGILKSIHPTFVTMKANTALAFVLAGVSLWLLRSERTARWTRPIAHACALTVALIGLLTLSEYLFDWNPGIDQLLFQEPAGAVATSSPGRMAPIAALNFFLLGLAVLLLDVKTRRGVRPAQLLVLAEGLIAFFALIGYVYNVTALYGAAAHTKMAVHTALTFLVACLAVLCARPNCGLMVLVTSDTSGGILMRRLLPATISIPVVLGLLRLVGQRFGLYEGELGMLIMAGSNLCIFLILIVSTSGFLNRLDVEHRTAEAQLRRQGALTRLLQVAAVAANQAKTVEEALHVCLAQVCESTSWPVGHVYLTSPDGSLASTPIWHVGSPPQYETLIKRFQVISATACSGLPSRALATKKPVWTSDLSQDPELLEVTTGEDLGIRGAFALPIFVGQDVVAVLEFFSLETREPDTQLLEVLAHIGTQLGRMVERQRAQEEIRASNKRLKELAMLKDEFVAKVSHELRTPLTSIKEGLSLFLDNALGETTAEQQDFLKTIDQDIDRLAELINNMLDISKIEAGRMQLLRQRTDLGSLIDQAIQSYQPILGHRTVRRVSAEVPPVFADALRVTQVLTNLLSNAVKFTPDDGVVTFRLDHQDGMVVVAVEDTGAGIAPEELPKLFQKFSQVGLRGAGRPRGTGLGLVICKELVELHKGRIDVASVVGRGTTFRIGLPVYTDQFALTESFNELADVAAASGEPEVAVIAIQAEALPESGAGETLPWSRLEAVAEDVRHHVHRRDLVLTVAPSWAVLLAATDAPGAQAIVGRLRGVLRDGQRLSFGTAVSPEDGTDAMTLFAKAMNALELRATSQDGAG